MDALHGRKLNVWRNSLTATTQECYEQYWTSPRRSTPQNSSCTAAYHPSRKLSKLDEPDLWDTAGEVGTSSWMMYYCGPLHMDEQKQDDQLCANTRCSPEDLPKAIDDREGGERESQGYPCWWHDMMMMMIVGEKYLKPFNCVQQMCSRSFKHYVYRRRRRMFGSVYLFKGISTPDELFNGEMWY